MKRICVFLGSNAGTDPRFRSAVISLAQAMGGQGLDLVYGGGSVGLMGVLADAVLEAGGEVIGVIPQALATKEVAHFGLKDLRIVETMHERKALMAELADAFIALPGGLGTLDEFCEILTWAQLGIHQKPCGLLNAAGFYDAFLAHLDHATKVGFLRPEHRSLVVTDEEATRLLAKLREYQAPSLPKWLNFGNT